MVTNNVKARDPVGSKNHGLLKFLVFVKNITKLKNLHIEIKCDPRAAQRTETNHFYVDWTDILHKSPT